jgi:hypothetical protein
VSLQFKVQKGKNSRVWGFCFSFLLIQQLSCACIFFIEKRKWMLSCYLCGLNLYVSIYIFYKLYFILIYMRHLAGGSNSMRAVGLFYNLSVRRMFFFSLLFSLFYVFSVRVCFRLVNFSFFFSFSV